MRQRYNLSFRREQQKKERTRRVIAIVVVIFVFAAIGTLIYFALNNIDWSAVTNNNGNDDKKQVAKEEKEKAVEININAVGDIMAQSSQLTSAKDGEDYDFDGSFEYVKKYIDKADLSIANLETTFGGSPYLTYPRYSSPKELAEAVKSAGFDVAITSNDHMLDTGKDGLEKTIEALDDIKLHHTGTVADPDDKNYLVAEVKGVKIGIVSYASETSYGTGSRTLRGNIIADDEKELINSYSPRRLEEDKEDIEDTINAAKEDGAQFIICYFSWGDEYDATPNDSEQELAEAVADMGADVIFATNPHVLQEMDTIKNKDDKEVPVFYSLGNFLSAQRYETIGSRAVEEGMIAQVKLVYDTSKKEVKSVNADYLPTWINRYLDEDANKNLYTIVPLVDGFEDNPTIKSADNASKAEDILESIIELLGEPGSSTDNKEEKEKSD